jgi:lysozyme
MSYAICRVARPAACGILVAILALASAAPARDLGVDISHFQGATGMPQTNWSQLAAEGRTFAYIKATEGLLPPGNVDLPWATNVQRAQDAGILAGVYHFGRPDNRPLPIGAVAEAGHFVATAGSAMGPGNLRPVLDLEMQAAGMTPEALSDWVLAFVGEVVRLKGPEAEPIVYCSTFYAQFELDNRVAGLDAWIRSINGQNPQTGAPSTTGVFADWAFWQYQVGSAGGVNPIDLNVQHSDAMPLSAFVIPEPATATIALLAAATGLTARRRR